MVPDGCLWHLRLLDLEANAAIDWRSLERVWFLPKYGSTCDMRMLIFRRLTVGALENKTNLTFFFLLCFIYLLEKFLFLSCWRMKEKATNIRNKCYLF